MLIPNLDEFPEFPVMHNRETNRDRLLAHERDLVFLVNMFNLDGSEDHAAMAQAALVATRKLRRSFTGYGFDEWEWGYIPRESDV